MRQFIYSIWYTVAKGTQSIATIIIIIIIIFNKMGSSKKQSRWLRNKKKGVIWMFEVYWGWVLLILFSSQVQIF